MSQLQGSREERIARYKEERRRQIREQFNDSSNKLKNKDVSSSSSGTEGPRTTRAYRLRVAAASASISNSNEPATKQQSSKEVCLDEAPSRRQPKPEKDKSSVRKSNLNRALNSEAVYHSDSDERNTRGNRRRCPRTDNAKALNQSISTAELSDATSQRTASNMSPLSSPIITAPKARTNVVRKSELSIHMENARKSVTTFNSDLGKHSNRTCSITCSPNESQPSSGMRTANKENIKSGFKSDKYGDDRINIKVPSSSNDAEKVAKGCSNIPKRTSRRLEELTALTRATLALASSNTQPIAKTSSHTLEANTRSQSSNYRAKINDNCTNQQQSVPVSILKRKVSQEETKWVASTPPVTFSPNVIEPSETKRKQGILKKRRSLDESQVLRHRSCSPDVAGQSHSFSTSSILKSQRRSSLEEIIRTSSDNLQGILKHKSQRCDADADTSLNSPQGILKRRSGASSAGSTHNSSHQQHVSIATAVILAAADGAEIILDSESVRPILKKKSISEEGGSCSNAADDLKPILKKKSSTDTEDNEEKPKRPILKIRSKDSDKDYYSANESGSECDVKPILKFGCNKEDGPSSSKARLSFCDDNFNGNDFSIASKSRYSRRLQSDQLNITSNRTQETEIDRDLTRQRTLSVSELVMNFESSTGAIPKRSINPKRTSDRYRTQPVTFNEFEASLNYIRTPYSKDFTASNSSTTENVHSVPNLSSTSLDNDLSNCLLNSLSNVCNDGAAVKMSSDSAFQSLGDGQEIDEATVVKSPMKLEVSKLATQMKAIALEAKGLKLRNSKEGGTKTRLAGSRYSTQPITSAEVDQASKLKTHRGTSDATDISPSCSKTKDDQASDYQKHTLENENKSSKPETMDEGISSNDSDSDSPKNLKLPSISLSKSAIGLCTQSNNLNLSSDHTSDESSGGREIKSIVGINLEKRKHLRKSQRDRDSTDLTRSSSAVSNEAKSSFPKSVSPGLQKSLTTAAMQSTISELRAKLQHSGDNDWRKRTSKLNPTTEELSSLKAKNFLNDELSEKSLLEKRKDELDASSKQWKNRVEKGDADNFSVAGRMSNDNIPLNIETRDKIRRTPSAKRFRGRDANVHKTTSQPTSPEIKESMSFRRTNSSPSSDDIFSCDATITERARRVSILVPNDDTFKSFFKSVESKHVNDHIDVNVEDFDTMPVHTLLVQKKNIKVQKRRGASRNPLKALAAREDIQHEYIEVLSGFAEREVKRLNVEKLAKNSHLSIEALAGLASKEDIKSVSLKKTPSITTGSYLPFKSLMLLQIKGRRHVQTRLVEPVAASINEGDNYILITPTTLYNYVGSHSNIIEQSRASDIINHIQQSNDMGCKSERVVILNSDTPVSNEVDEFWRLLGADNKIEVTKAGHPDEDEVYESSIVDTNMVYSVESNELVPDERYWSAIPKIEMLGPSKVYVFDFGSEMYIWSGKNADPNEKKTALKLAKELWENGYNYSECSLCPINVAEMLGARSSTQKEHVAAVRPDWALMGKITQHRETVLFREKFLDWPDYSRVVKVKKSANSSDRTAISDPIMDQIKPFNAQDMVNLKYIEPNFEIEGSNLGRGRHYFDEETRRHFEINTLDIAIWTILENTYEKLDQKDLGHFYDSGTYIIRWQFRVSVAGRELSGKPSKHMQLGRDRCVYFSWLGENASINEKGTAALLTVELDSEQAKQIRITQGMEPPVFLQLFNGKMVIHRGKSDDEQRKEKLFILRGEMECETSLIEVPVSMRSLRSRCCFIYVESKQIAAWFGAKAPEVLKTTCKQIALGIKEENHATFNLSNDAEFQTYEEGKEDSEFLNCLGEKPQLYYSLKDKSDSYNNTPRLFKFSSVTGVFEASEILCPHRSVNVTPYPFLQSVLYASNQPALFLFDNEYEIWVWQGWWPEKENDTESFEQTGSGPVRWQAERRAAMQTAIDYWTMRYPDKRNIKAYLVWAGLEPLQFTNLFPVWCDRDDIAALNIKCGINSGDMIPIEKELAVLTRTTYPLAELLQRPLPIGVDPTHLEIYLSPDDFYNLLSLTKEDFQQLPSWKQTKLKKEKGLF